MPEVIENLTDDEAYLYSILMDPCGLDLAEFVWYDPDPTNPDGCFRAWPFQWKWFRCAEPLQIDQCLAEGTLVLTRRGHVPIEDVVPGDEVLTHECRWRAVTHKWDRGEQDVVAVRGYGHWGLRATADHPFLLDSGWASPVGGSRWMTPRGFPQATVPPMPPRAYKPGRPSNVPYDVESPEFLWLYGLYLAEGTLSSSYGKGGTLNRVTWSVHTAEVADVGAMLAKVGLRFGVSPISGEACSNVVVNSRQLAEWLNVNAGRGSITMNPAAWPLGLRSLQRLAILDGLAYGDGYDRTAARTELSTRSKALVFWTRLLAQSLQMSASVTTTATRDNHINGRLIRGGRSYQVGWQPIVNQRAPRVQPSGNHFRSMVSAVTSAGVARCYDLEVEDDHSFVAEGIVVHNCARSVGKTLSITLRMFSFPFRYPGQEAVVTAPELVHLEPVTNLIERRFDDSRLGREMLPHGRGAITHRPFMMNFTNGARIIGRIPQRDGKGVKGLHPIWLELDEAQDYPAAGWTELIETLKRGHEGATWRAHGVTRGIRDHFYEFTQDSPSNPWTVHRVTAMHRPNWTDEERQEKVRQYKSRDNPDYRRNVRGLHGDATNPLFVLHRLMRVVDDDLSSDYNLSEYQHYQINHEQLTDRGASHDVIDFLDFPERHRAYRTTWAGMDVGYTNHPSELLIFGEEKAGSVTRLKLLTRIHLERISNPQQCRVISTVFNFYRPQVFAMDKTGVGLPLFQDLQEMAPELANQIKGYNFSEKILVDFDESAIAEMLEGEDDVKEAGIFKNVLEFATDKLREMVDKNQLWLPWDTGLIGEFQGQTWSYSKEAMDMYGRRRRVYSQGSFHALDAARMAALGYVQRKIEEMMRMRRQTDERPVFDYVVDFG